MTEEQSTDTQRPITIASCDAHAGMPPELFHEYFEEKYWPDLERLVAAECDLYRDVLELTAFPLDELEAIDDSYAWRSGGQLGAWDPQRRLQEMDREGIAWELLYMGTPDGNRLVQSPFAWELSEPYPAKLRAAGARAYNRWLADHVAAMRGRVAGAALVGPCTDIVTEVTELRWLADHGMAAVYAPGFPADPSLPPLSDPYYEPFWSACAESGLKLAFHVNWGVPQEGTLQSMTRAYKELKAAGGDAVTPQSLKLKLAREGQFHDANLPPRRAIWQLMVGGVFDRHPSLGIVLTELRADWTPAYIAYLDELFDKGAFPSKQRPSYYWERNVRLTPSFVHPVEMQMRNEIGMNLLMFGRDYPHPEGTWPNTWDWLRGALVGVREDETRAFLGGNAIEFFGLDRNRLDEIAARIGPKPADLLDEHPLDPRKLASFDRRGGYNKPAQEINLVQLAEMLVEDLQRASL